MLKDIAPLLVSIAVALTAIDQISINYHNKAIMEATAAIGGATERIKKWTNT